MKPPFPWFGGKSRAAELIWQGLGTPPNYVEPFAGSLAALLLRPGYDPLQHTETINDLDCFVANFWRSLSLDPEQTAYYADYPVNEADLHARHQWLVNQSEFREAMMTNPDHYDPKIAGWWVWGLCQWIGSGWCADTSKSRRGYPRDSSKGVYRQRPDLHTKGILSPSVGDADASGDNGMGVHRKLPHLGNNGRGVHRKRPHLQGESFDSRALTGVCASPASSFGEQRDGRASQASEQLYDYFEALSIRLRRVRVCCGDWTRVLGPSPTEKLGVTGILLDPPYAQDLRHRELYATETPVSDQVREWAIAHGDNPMLRIALCGYADEHDMPDSWTCIEWKAGGGYDGQNRDRANDNRKKERIWFSPHCQIRPQTASQLSLFGVA